MCDLWQGFVQTSNLATHARARTGEKPDLCVSCGKSVGQASVLITHARTHMGEKSYVCLTCGQGFAQTGDLRGMPAPRYLAKFCLGQ